jgi:hypothetical protein
MVIKRQQETFEPVTMRHICFLGYCDLLVYCISGRCHQSATLSGEWLPDETPVRSLQRGGKSRRNKKKTPRADSPPSPSE